MIEEEQEEDEEHKQEEQAGGGRPECGRAGGVDVNGLNVDIVA